MDKIGTNSEPAKLDSCDHEFCYPCIKSWSQLTNFCPLCKVEYFKILYLENGQQKVIHVNRQKFKFFDKDENNEVSKKCLICDKEELDNPLDDLDESDKVMKVCIVCKFNVCHLKCMEIDDRKKDKNQNKEENEGWICKVCNDCMNE